MTDTYTRAVAGTELKPAKRLKQLPKLSAQNKTNVQSGDALTKYRKRNLEAKKNKLRM